MFEGSYRMVALKRVFLFLLSAPLSLTLHYCFGDRGKNTDYLILNAIEDMLPYPE